MRIKPRHFSALTLSCLLETSSFPLQVSWIFPLFKHQRSCCPRAGKYLHFTCGWWQAAGCHFGDLRNKSHGRANSKASFSIKMSNKLNKCYRQVVIKVLPGLLTNCECRCKQLKFFVENIWKLSPIVCCRVARW